MKHRFRLRSSNDIERVRRLGKSYAHPLVVLVALPNEGEETHIAVSAGRSVGGAVQRNRSKRLIREAIRPLFPHIQPGWDLVFLARQRLAQAAFQDAQDAVRILVHRAHLLKEDNG